MNLLSFVAVVYSLHRIALQKTPFFQQLRFGELTKVLISYLIM